jgi:hypothetical protein
MLHATAAYCVVNGLVVPRSLRTLKHSGSYSSLGRRYAYVEARPICAAVCTAVILAVVAVVLAVVRSALTQPGRHAGGW